MNKYNPHAHHRKSIRLKGYDYSQAGLYFITICCQDRICRFGNVFNGQMILNAYGIIAFNEWLKTAELRPNVELGEFIIMPNHMHAIIRLSCRGELHSPNNNGTTELHSPNNNGATELHSPDQTGVCKTPLRAYTASIAFINTSQAFFSWVGVIIKGGASRKALSLNKNQSVSNPRCRASRITAKLVSVSVKCKANNKPRPEMP